MNILLVGFNGNEDSSKLLLDLLIPKYYQDKLYLGSQKKRATEELIAHIGRKPYDYMLIFTMKNTLVQRGHLEFAIGAAKEKDGLETNFLYEGFKEHFAEHNIHAETVRETEDGMANQLYYTSLKHIYDNQLKTRCLLINLPTIAHIDVMKLSYQMTNYFSVLAKAK